jgi:O-antigen/teichoic acid export membrane protein
MTTSSPAIEVVPAQPVTAKARSGLLQAASGSFALNVLNLVATVVLTAVLTRAMTVDAFGIYSWVIAAVTLLTVPAVLGVDRLLVRDVAVYLSRAAHAQLRGLVRWTFALVTIVSLVIVGAGVAVSLLTGAMSSTQWAALAIGLVALPFVAGGRVLGSALMGGGQIVVGQIPELALRPALMLLLVAVMVLALGTPLDAGVVVAVYAATAAMALLVALAILDRRLLRGLEPARPSYETRTWGVAAVALALLSGAALINSQTGIALLGLLDTPSATGLYSVAQRGALLVAFPLLAVNAALAPTAARLWAAREVDQLQRLVTRAARATLAASAAIAIVFIAFGRPLLGAIFGGPFTEASGALTILTIGQVANVATGSVALLLVMSGNQWRAGLGIVAGMLLNIGLGVVLIPTLHADGAAIAAAASLICSNTIHVFIARRALGIDPTPLGLPAVHRA